MALQEKKQDTLKTQRKAFSKSTMAAVFLAAGGKCQHCTEKLLPGKVEYDHILPCGLGGGNALDNCQCLCPTCHLLKTKADVKQIAKTKRQHNKHHGIQTRKHKTSIPSRPFSKPGPAGKRARGAEKPKHKWQSSPLPGSKASGWKKNMDGTVTRREVAA